jgi:hypothetical protein
MNEPLSRQELAELEQLINKVYEDIATQAELLRLDEMVCGSSEARIRYVEIMNLRAQLLWDLSLDKPVQQDFPGAGDSTPPALESSALVQPKPSSWSRAALRREHPALYYAGIMAATLLLWAGFLAWVLPWWRDEGKPSVANVNPVNRPLVATVTGMHQPEWAEGANEWERGAKLRAGRRVLLDSGLVELTFVDGARTILEGPCKFVVDTGGAGTLEVGKLVAKVPQRAAGFAVDTPCVRAVDLGTEFGIYVDPDGDTVTHVFDGRVLVSPSSGASWPPRELIANQTLKAEQSSVRLLAPNDPDVASFVGTLPRSENPALAALVSVDIGANHSFERRATVSAVVGDHREADLNDPGQNATDDQIGIWAGAGPTNWWNSSASAATALVDANGDVTGVSYSSSQDIGTDWAGSPSEDLGWDGYFVRDGTITTTVRGLPAETTFDLIVYHAEQHVSETVTVNGASAIDYTGSLANPGYGDAFDGLAGSDFWYFRVATDRTGSLVISCSGAAFNSLTGFQLQPLANEVP